MNLMTLGLWLAAILIQGQPGRLLHEPTPIHKIVTSWSTV